MAVVAAVDWVEMVSVAVWLWLVMLYFEKVNVVAFVAVAVEAEFVILVDFSAVVLEITELPFSVLDRRPYMRTRITQSSISDQPLEKIFF